MSSTPEVVALPSRRAAAWLLGAILVVAALLRLRLAMQTPLWFDELFSLHLVRQGFAESMRLSASDVHPPLHDALLWTWRALFGERAMLLKTLPLLAGLATIAALYGFVSDAFGRRAGLLAAALFAFQRSHIGLSQELRSYELFTLATVLSAWSAWRYETRGRARDALLFALAGAFALWTHYLGFVVIASIALWGIVDLARRGERERLVDWLWPFAGMAALFLPILPLFLSQQRLHHEHWVPAPRPIVAWEILRQNAFGISYLALTLPAFAALAFREREKRAAAGALAWFAIVPVLAMLFLSLSGARLFLERYVVFVVPLWSALFAVAATSLPRRLAPFAAAVLLIFAARSALTLHPKPEAVALDRAASFIVANSRPGDAVYCADTHSLYVLMERLAPRRARLVMAWPRLPYYEGALFVPDSLRVPPEAVREAVASGARWWGVRTRHGGIPSVTAAAMFDSMRAERTPFDMVTVWRGAGADTAR